MGREPYGNGVTHGVEGAALLVFERLRLPQQKEGRCRRASAGETSRGNRAGCRNIDLLDVWVGRCPGIRGVKEFLAQGIGCGGPRKSLVEEHGAIWHGGIQLRQCGMAMFRPLIRMPATHGSDPGAYRDVFAPGCERLLHVFDRGRVLQNGVISRPVSQAHDVDMRFHQTGQNCSATQVDRTNTTPGFGHGSAYGNDAVVTNGHGVDNRVRRIHRMNLAVGKDRGVFVERWKGSVCACAAVVDAKAPAPRVRNPRRAIPCDWFFGMLTRICSLQFRIKVLWWMTAAQGPRPPQ